MEEGKKRIFWFRKFLDPAQIRWKFQDPLYSRKKSFSIYRVHYIQNDRLELTISTQKLVLKNMRRGLKYQPNFGKRWRFGLVSQARIHMKMLAGDYFTYRQSGEYPNCKCFTPLESIEEDICHILVICQQYSDARNIMLSLKLYVCKQRQTLNLKKWEANLTLSISSF